MADATIAVNRKARHDYFVEDTYEAGIELSGTEIKSIRQGGANLKDSWCNITGGEIFNKDPLRVRKLLMHKKEIHKLFGLVKQESYTLIPLSLYYNGSRVKLSVGLCKGKKLHDKREDAARRDAKREMDRAVRQRLR